MLLCCCAPALRRAHQVSRCSLLAGLLWTRAYSYAAKPAQLAAQLAKPSAPLPSPAPPQGDSCRFSHTLPSAGADAQHPQRLLGLQRLSGGAPTPPAAPQQQPGAGGVLSFGAPGAAAFAGSGAPGSAPASRAGTPDMRLGGVAAPGPGGEAQGAAIPASSSGFSVNAPSFSPREPLSSSSSNAAAAAAAAGGLLPGAASLPAFAGLGAPLALDSFAGGRYSRPGSAVNSGEGRSSHSSGWRQSEGSVGRVAESLSHAVLLHVACMLT